MKNTSIRWRRLPGALWWHLISTPEGNFLGMAALIVLAFGLACVGFARNAREAKRYEAAALSITPITSYSDGASGLTFSGDAYDVTCTVSGDTVTLYAAMHDGTSWRVYDATSCTLAVGSGRTCRFPAEKQTGQTWNAYKTGSGSVASCTAKQAFGPLSRAPSSGGGGGGGATTVPQLRWSPVNRVAQRGITPSYGSSDITFGTAWIFTKALTITGIRFYWGGAATVTAKLWLPDGSVGASCSASPAGAGITSCNFASAYTITAGNLGKIHMTTTYDGVHYTYHAAEDAGPFPIATRNTGPMLAGPWVYEIISGAGTGVSGFYISGDAMPNYPDSDAFVEPIITDASS